MNKNNLSHAIRGTAEDIRDSVNPDTAELLRVLARLVEGMPMKKAFGAPGNWGYGTPIGDALASTE